MANLFDVDAHERLLAAVADEVDDVLCTLALVRGEPSLEDRLYSRLVDLLVESMFLDLRKAYLAGGVDRDDYVAQLAELADACRGAGLLPLPSRGA